MAVTGITNQAAYHNVTTRKVKENMTSKFNHYLLMEQKKDGEPLPEFEDVLTAHQAEDGTVYYLKERQEKIRDEEELEEEEEAVDSFLESLKKRESEPDSETESVTHLAKWHHLDTYEKAYLKFAEVPDFSYGK